MNIAFWQWTVMIGLSLILLISSPISRNVSDFFKGSKNGAAPSNGVLIGSLVISWIFAKSVTNAANLGYDYGLVGGLAYAAYYLSFIVAGLVLYQIRQKGRFQSLHQFLSSKFGARSLMVFSALISLRLFNEIWSNSLVVGSYFGETGSWSFYGSILVFTGLTTAYTMKGGMRSSIFTDTIQFVLFGALLLIVLFFIFQNDFSFQKAAAVTEWKMDAGIDLLLVAVLQVFSYPFHDPVMTDRAFMNAPNKMLSSFLWAGIIGGLCIFLFSLIGVYGKAMNLESPVLKSFSLLFGGLMMLAINTIMMSSAASTIDSALASSTKLWHLDIRKSQNLSVTQGRITMAIVAIIGTLPVFFDPEILSATTISGTMVLGLAPVFIFWKKQVPKASFFLPVMFGVLLGTYSVIGHLPESMHLGDGKYAELLSFNVIGVLGSLILYFMPTLFKSSE